MKFAHGSIAAEQSSTDQRLTNTGLRTALDRLRSSLRSGFQAKRNGQARHTVHSAGESHRSINYLARDKRTGPR